MAAAAKDYCPRCRLRVQPWLKRGWFVVLLVVLTGGWGLLLWPFLWDKCPVCGGPVTKNPPAMARTAQEAEPHRRAPVKRDDLSDWFWGLLLVFLVTLVIVMIVLAGSY